MKLAIAHFLVADVETTGLRPEHDRVVELALVLTSASAVVDHGGLLVNPGRPIPPEASAIHHLTDEDVAGAPDLTEALRTFGAVVSRIPDVYVAHNARFDSAFLPMLRRAPWLCTMRMARHLYPDLESYSNQALRYALHLQVPEAEGQQAHRAEADALVTAALLRHMLADLPADWPDTVEDLVARVQQPLLLKTCRFGKHRGRAWSEVPADYLRWLLGQPDGDPDVQHTARHWLGVTRG